MKLQPDIQLTFLSSIVISNKVWGKLGYFDLDIDYCYADVLVWWLADDIFSKDQQKWWNRMKNYWRRSFRTMWSRFWKNTSVSRYNINKDRVPFLAVSIKILFSDKIQKISKEQSLKNNEKCIECFDDLSRILYMYPK